MLASLSLHTLANRPLVAASLPLLPTLPACREYLSDLCPTWVHGVLDNLAEVVAPLADSEHLQPLP
jgi:hypothetical protein